jgi:hypothetical protein
MAYKELRVWARGRNRGWGEGGELQFYIKIGRDPSNFYLYRTPVNAGSDRAAWLPEVRVDFERLFALRAQVQSAFMRGERQNSCTGVDSALVANSRLPAGRSPADVYAACDGGYMVYTVDPNVSPPNLAAVQELAVGMVRVDSAVGPTPILDTPTDTLELWVDDIRLAHVVNTPGYAGQLSLAVNAGDAASLRVNVSRVDANFRQLAEQPRFIGDQRVDVGTSVRLDRFLPQRWGVALPLTVSYGGSGSDPYFVSRSDIRGAGIDGLRTPRQSTTAYSLSVRRIVPVDGAALGALLNNVALTASYATASTRSEYQDGAGRSFNLGLDYDVQTRPREQPLPGWAGSLVARMPGWMRNSEAIRALSGSSLRWNPAQIRFSSRMGRQSDRRQSFTQPAATAADTARIVRGLTNVWQNTGDIELRPFNAVSARIGVISVRDLRDYRDGLGDTTASAADVAQVAAAERGQLLGMDVGLERERTMSTSVSFTPAVLSWLRPRLDVGTQYSMLRDPNARVLVSSDSSGDDYATECDSDCHLPRRLSNAQTFTAGTAVDLGRMVGALVGDSGAVRRVANAFRLIDVTYHRTVQSNFDGTPFTPGLGYQLAIGGADVRRLGGQRASSAGVGSTFTVSGDVALPLGAALVMRFQRGSTRSWMRLQDTVQRPVDGTAVTFPNLSLRWNYTPPPVLRGVLASLGANASLERTRTTSFAPSVVVGTPDEQGRAVHHRYPLNGSITWALAGGFSTSASYVLTTRDELRPGLSTYGRTRDLSLDLGKTFPVPKSWSIDNRLNTRVGYQRSATRNLVRDLSGAGLAPRPLADNGRESFNVNADTRLAETLTFSLVGSRIVNFDNQFSRRFTQTVFSAVLQMSFFAGELR